MKNKYRIVTDNYRGYAAEVKRWWWPLWVQLPSLGSDERVRFSTNTCGSVEEARALIARYRAGTLVPRRKRKLVVEYVEEEGAKCPPAPGS